MPFFFLLLLFHFLENNSAQNYGSCQTLEKSVQNRLQNPCVYVVDYSFFVPTNTTPEELAKNASSLLSSKILINLSGACQGALVRYICSTIYLKCQPHLDFNNISTWNHHIYKSDTNYTISLPFQRPCVSACTSIATYCNTPTYGLISSLNTLFTVSCIKTYNYAQNTSLSKQPYQFDNSNNLLQCFLPNQISLSGPTEKYLRTSSAPCLGLVDTFLMIPGDYINGSYTTLQPPGIIQTIMNNVLTAKFNQLPQWLKPSCHLALSQYICYQVYLPPQAINIGSAFTYSILLSKHANQSIYWTNLANYIYPGLFSSFLYFQSYPHRSYRENYQDTCLDFLEIANISTLIPNCSQENTQQLSIFPIQNQTVFSAIRSFPLQGTSTFVPLTILFQTSPNNNIYYNSSEYTYTVQCPPRYVENIYHTKMNRLKKIPGSGCAVKCQSTEWTENEWNHYIIHSKALAIAGIICAIMTIILLLICQDWKTDYLIGVYTMMNLFISSYFYYVQQISSFETRYCENTSVGKNLSFGNSACVSQAIACSYLFLSGSLTILCISFQRFLIFQQYSKYNNNNNNSNISNNDYYKMMYTYPYQILQFIIIFLIPIIFIMLGTLYDYYGYFLATPYCFMDQYASPFLLALPQLIISIITYMIMFITFIYVKKYKFKNVRAVVVNSSERLDNNNNNNNNNQSNNNNDDFVVLYSNYNNNMDDDAAEERAIVAKEITHTNNNNKKNNNVTIDAMNTTAMLSPTTTDNNDNNRDNNNKSSFFELSELEIYNAEYVLGGILLGSMFIYLSFIILSIGQALHLDDYNNSFKDYTACIFQYYDGITKESYYEYCGDHPTNRPKIGNVNLYMTVIFSQMVVMGPVYICAKLLCRLKYRSR
jgi:hypothetical protein